MTTRTIKKNLAGEEDILYGEGSVIQTRNDASYNITKVHTIKPVSSITELNALDTEKFTKAALFETSGVTFYQYSAGSGLWEIKSSVTHTDLITYNYGSTDYTLSDYLAGRHKVSPLDFDVVGDGIADDTDAMKALAAHTDANPRSTIEFPSGMKIKLTDTVQFKKDVYILGNQAQIYQSTTSKACLIFGDNLTGGGNYKNGWKIQDLMCGNVDKTAACIEYRNINSSNIKNVFAVGGAIGHRLRGCILSHWECLFASTQLNGVPGFFGTVGGIDEGIKLESYEGLACNENTFIRPWGLGCAVSGMEVNGANNTIIGHDFEGIESPADHLILNGKTNVYGGDIEGTGGGLVVNSGGSYSHITGINNLSFLRLQSGVTGVKVGESVIKLLVIDAGSSNCVIENIKINTGGSATGIQAGTNNTVRNVYDINLAAERGLNRSGSFTPILEFGGGSTGATWSQQRGEYSLENRVMHFKVQLQINSKSTDTGTATVNLNDLPFAAKNDTLDTLVEIKVSGVTYGSGNSLSASLTYSTKTVKLQTVADTTGTVSNLDNTDFSSGDTIWLSGWFFI
jgi:hypothetical protein